MSDELQDPLKLAEQALAAGADAEAEFATVTRKLFETQTGRRWMVLAMAKYNFMGGVFDPEDGFNERAAAARDGARAVLSEILNAIAKAKQKNDDDDE